MKKQEFSVSLSAMTIISVLIASFTAVLICTVIFTTVYSSSLVQNASVNSAQTIGQTTKTINIFLETMKDKLTVISDELQDSADFAEFNNRISAVAKIQDDIQTVIIYDTDGNILDFSEEGKELKENVVKDLSFNKELFVAANDFALSTPHVQTIFKNSYPWVITIAKATQCDFLGKECYIAIDFDFSQIIKYIDNVGIGSHGYCYIIDSSGNIIYHPQQQLLSSGLKTEANSLIKDYNDGVHIKDEVIYTLQTTSESNWRIAGVTYTDELAIKERSQIVFIIVVSVIANIIISATVLLIYSKIVTAPVRSLTKAMKKFEKDGDSFVYSGGQEKVLELKELSKSFEHMERQIIHLMDEVRKEETELRKTELKALQAQINPHFLYNTLDSIQWMCEQGNTESAAKMVGALAKLFRKSISRGHELITIKDEIQHASSYLIIQSYRYKDQFKYSFTVEEDLEDYLCNKITIQPLIENAIYHGIDRMVDEGYITIAVKTDPENSNNILITVSDNGIGMTEEQCRKILSKARSDSNGIGVKNVNDRLKMYFGEEYGLSIESELDVGTTVTVRLPKIKEYEEK